MNLTQTSWMLAVGALAAVPGRAAPAPPALHAYSWEAVPPECRHITHMVWIRQESDPAEIVREAIKRPAGHRFLFSWDLHRGLLEDPADRCRTPGGEPTAHPGVWSERGTAAVRARFDDFLRRFKEAGGQADALILDFEGGYSNWHLGGTQNLERWLAIQNDPRFPALAKKLGFSDLRTVADWRSGRNYLKWNAVTAGLVDEALNRAVFEPARRHFPGILCANYGSVVVSEANAYPDLNGHLGWREGVPAGTHQSPSLYTSIGQLADRLLDGKKPFGRSAFVGLLLNLNGVRAMRRSSPVPLMPWIAWQRYAGDGPGRPVAAAGNTPYYQELVRHLALHGVDAYLFWNPHPWRPNQDPEGLSLPKDEKLLDGVLADLNRRLAGRRGAPATLAAIPWDAEVLASGLRVDDRMVWRLTLPADARGVRVGVDGQEQTLAPEVGEVGVWYEAPAAAALRVVGVVR